MITQNFKTLISSMLCRNGTESYISGSDFSLKTTGGSVQDSTYLYMISQGFGKTFDTQEYLYANSELTKNSYGWMYLYCGSGTTPASVDDYTLEAPLTNPGVSYGENGISCINGVYTISRTVTNNSAENITIGEIGVILGMANSSTTPIYANPILIARETPTPVVLAPGESKTFTMQFDFI